MKLSVSTTSPTAAAAATAAAFVCYFSTQLKVPSSVVGFQVEPAPNMFSLSLLQRCQAKPSCVCRPLLQRLASSNRSPLLPSTLLLRKSSTLVTVEPTPCLSVTATEFHKEQRSQDYSLLGCSWMLLGVLAYISTSVVCA